MLEAFILGFWAIWSAGRDIYALTESLAFMILVVLLRTAIKFTLPEINAQWGIENGLMWAYVALVFWIINRFSSSFAGTMMMAAIAGLGYYQLSLHVGDIASRFIA